MATSMTQATFDAQKKFLADLRGSFVQKLDDYLSETETSMYTSRSAAAMQCFQMAVVFLTQSFPNLSNLDSGAPEDVDLRSKLDRLEQQNKKMMDKVSNLTKQNKSLSAKVSKLKKKVSCHDGHITGLRKLQQLFKMKTSIFQSPAATSSSAAPPSTALASASASAAPALQNLSQITTPSSKAPSDKKILNVRDGTSQSLAAVSRQVYFTSICRGCSVDHDTGIVSFNPILGTHYQVGQFISALPLTRESPSFSFVITATGQTCEIGIGVCPKHYFANRMPGWDGGSIAYHADNGGIYVADGRAVKCKEACTTGDIMKCTLNFHKQIVSFFRNGNLMFEGRPRFNFTALHAAVGFHTVGEAVRLLEKEPWREVEY